MSIGPKGTKTLTVAVPSGGATLLLAANGLRLTARIVNASGAVITYLGKDNTVSAASGVPLAVGAVFEDLFTTDAWWGITTGAAGDIRLMETA